MDGALLHVITFTPHTQAQAGQALRDLRRLLPRAGDERRALLLFCDLPDAPGERMPGDEPILRLLQSGVMSMDARRPGRTLLLVRRRAWSDAARAYVGEAQAVGVRQVIAGLLLDGRAQAVFDAATFSPASLRGQYAAVLFSPLSLSCTPDTPPRMQRALGNAPDGCVCGCVRPRLDYPVSALARLEALGFSLAPLRLARAGLLARRGLAPTDGPALFTPQALRALPAAAPLLADCPFVPREAASLRAQLDAFRAACLRRLDVHALLPLLQLALLFLGALLGSGALALLAVALPELWSFLHPRLLPGALARLALLPLTASAALDALLARGLARSRRLRIRLPLYPARTAVWSGAALLFSAMAGTHALAPLLPVSLLWLSAPLLLPALHAPTLERIPLSPEEQSRLRSLAESAFFDAHGHDAAPGSLRILGACAGCMLGLLEPDEAARQAQALLAGLTAAKARNSSAAQQAALLAAAQYLREWMGACDAALRSLPAQLESHVLSLPVPQGDGLLAAFLRAARREDASSEALHTPAPSARDEALDAVFLPLGPARGTPQSALTLPLTHPHTFLRDQALPDTAPAQGDPAARLLVLTAAALEHPFYPLLMRSPVAGPYAALLACAPRAAR